ncbi:xylan glycosyltransferase MUCI21-like isoform X2 [Rhododendron vialii]|uniref:xylan glycosyltransferase MUCI21-like isoform X2 n=1 Tax=Rhododendron vialii TaxID=182163 RepID=UPI00265D99EA|nr:xylan glycosyltransferase MUCI21-like isoform X2 [Rhododendron vialii]
MLVGTAGVAALQDFRIRSILPTNPRSMTREPLQNKARSSPAHDLAAQECKYDSLPTMLRASCAQIMKKKNVSTILVVCLLLLLFFYLLNVVVLFYLLNIARVISRSYATRSTTTRDLYTQTYIQEKPWNQVWESPEPTWSITCDTAHFEYDLCYLNRPTVIDPTTSTVSAVDPTNSTPPTVIKTRPYPRKGQPEAMQRTRELTLTTSPLNASCAVTHNSPALIFSAGGFAGNVFHDFNEGWVPLFVTVDEHFVDRDIILAVVDCNDWWLVKYAELFSHFTRHPIVNLDKETAAHCFPSAIVGLKTHGVMIVDPTLQRGPRPKTMLDFRALLANAYDPSLALPSQVLPTFSSDARPKLAFLNRMDTRKLINEADVRQAAEEVGFDVAVFGVTSETLMRDLFRLVDSSHAMVAVHGAGCTHELFLRPGSVFVQIVPINCGWLADMCYGKLAIRLGLEYIVYEAGIHESTLETDDFAVRQAMEPHDPASSLMGNLTNWNRYMSQHVKVDVVRFKRYLKRAYEKAKLFAQKQNSQS